MMVRKPKVFAGLALGILLAVPACDVQTDSDAAGSEASVKTVDLEGTERPERAPDGTLTAIPAQFHGIWDNEDGNCNPASDLRMEISGNGIGFYESMGKLNAVKAAEDGGLSVDLAMEGEGETWTNTIGLTLSGEGADERLLVQYQGEGEPPQTPLKLKRCPA